MGVEARKYASQIYPLGSEEQKAILQVFVS